MHPTTLAFVLVGAVFTDMVEGEAVFALVLEGILQHVLGGKTHEEIQQQALYGHQQEQSVTIVVKKATGKRTALNASQKKLDIPRVEEHGNVPFSLKHQHKLLEEVRLLTQVRANTHAEIGRTPQPIRLLAKPKQSRLQTEQRLKLQEWGILRFPQRLVALH